MNRIKKKNEIATPANSSFGILLSAQFLSRGFRLGHFKHDINLKIIITTTKYDNLSFDPIAKT